MDEVPCNILVDTYAIDDLAHNTNNNFLLMMKLLKTEQENHKKLQEILGKSKYVNRIGTLAFGDV